ncbi:MAG: magnesium transporter CorA family protein, partial [Tannerellaceae bacterium]|nr:magnesium transporter CorA family protein [Tannerellaceae bacterium]
MKSFLYSEATGFVEKDHWSANCWVKVEKPTPDDIHYLINELQVPESFISDIEDTDERPRIESEDSWLLTILRIPIIENNKS